MSENNSVKRAALINAAGKYSKVLIAIIINSILARILSADDYGVVAVITVFSTFFATFSDMGFGPAIIQNKNLTTKDIDNIYSFTVYLSFILMILFIGSSYPISIFYENKAYIWLGILLSFSLLFDSLNMVPNGILNRDKRFILISIRIIIVYSISASLTVVLALLGFRYYALAIQSITTAFMTFTWNYITTRPKFNVRFKFSSIKKVLNYSSYQFAFNMVNYFSKNLDNLLTGKFMGDANLGYYNKAYTLMLYPVDNLTGVVTPVLHPILADYQREIKIIYDKYIRIFKILFCIGNFVAPFCYLAATEIIYIMYGANWNKSVICFQVLSLAIIPQMLNAISGGVFQAIGDTRLLFLNGCINTIITVIGILVWIFYGKSILMLSVCIAIAYIIQLITTSYILIKVGFEYRIREFFEYIKHELIILVGMIIAVVIYKFAFTNILLSFTVKFLYLGAIYIILLFVTREYKLFVSFIKR